MNRTANQSELVIERAEILSPTARDLILALNAELSGRYPEQGACHFRLDAHEVAEGRGAFLVAYRAQKPIGCGAVRRIEEQTGELKRMYVCLEERCRGVGRAILDALEAEARKLKITRLLLETGIRNPEAIALYERAGFSHIPPFGEYIGSPISVCMSKEIT
ncbi:MAG TPA: GNAT family N-acetyltransferase [Tepidisphaeraceae bacterium]|jgi:GNAT superfamily N-acetyltransferase|nr:GNAT family N-acetyltransferase [Tepidisphaeraceae bacterium]